MSKFQDAPQAAAAPWPPPDYLEGWYAWEYDKVFVFRWMASQARVLLPEAVAREFRYFVFPAFSEFSDYSQRLRVTRDGRELANLPLLYQWCQYSLDLRGGDQDAAPAGPLELHFHLNKVFPAKYHSGDGRELGIRLGVLDYHNDRQRHEDFLFFHKNAQLNHLEMMAGKTELASYPLNLGIDLYGKCNIKPPCVYCLWDRMKIMEGEQTDLVVDDRTLESYGPFFRAARNLVNCSFGEPLLHPRFQQILEAIGRNGKFLELSTNGQAFTERTVRALVGKPVYLYVSLDAATPETYAKIRNDRWAEIIPNLELLSRERKKAGNFPKLFMVFMPMRVNRQDLEPYFQLCQRLEADALVLRPLLYLGNPKIESDRGGYHFDYKNETLSRKENEDIIAEAGRLSQQYGVPLANQFNFGKFT